MRKCQQQKSINSDLPKIEFWSSFKNVKVLNQKNQQGQIIFVKKMNNCDQLTTN